MPEFLQPIVELLSGSLLAMLGALGILVAGWIIALIAAAIVRGALRRTGLDDRITQWIQGDQDGPKIDAARWVGKAVYYLIMLFVLVAFFQRLQLTVVTEPINALLNEVLLFVPGLLGAGMILLAAWVIASVLKFVVSRVLDAAKIDERLTSQADLAETDQPVISQSVASAVFWFIFLLFLPAVLNALGMVGLVEPVQNMFDQVLGALPNALGAGLILLVGWFIARIVRQILTNLLAAAGVDGFGERIGLGAALGEQRLSGVLGTIVYTLIMIQAVIAALDALAIESISRPATEMLNGVWDGIPAFLGAFVVLGVSYVIGRWVGQLVSNILTGVGFNNVLAWLGLDNEPAEGQRTPAEIVGYLVLLAVMLFATVEAAGLLGFSVVAELVAQLIEFGGQAVVALVIFGVGLYLANLARSVILSAGGRRATMFAQLARVAIIILVIAMALGQLGIANEIVNLAFGLLLGAIAVAAALAFGLGSREIAARQVEKWLKSLTGEEAGGD